MRNDVLTEILMRLISDREQQSGTVIDTFYPMDAITLVDDGSQLSHDLIDCFLDEFQAVLFGIVQR